MVSQSSLEKGNEELLNKRDFNTKQNSGIAGDIENGHEDIKTGHWGKETQGL